MKKTALLLLVLLMTAGFAATVYGADKSITGLGTGAIGSPVAPGDTGYLNTWTGSYVWFGNYSDPPSTNSAGKARYRVLSSDSTDFGGNTMLLDCDRVIVTDPTNDYIKFNVDSSHGTWEGCTLQTYLNTTFLNSYFSDQEINAMAFSNKEHPVAGDVTGYGNFGELTGSENDRIILLDSAEVRRADYGFRSDPGYLDAGRVKNQRNGVFFWWLRSAYGTGRAVYVYMDGRMYAADVENASIAGVSPAMNLKLSNIIFTSCVSGNEGQPGAEYKLTLSDNNLQLKVQEGAPVLKNGNEISIPYDVTNNDPSLNVDRITVLITDSEYVPGAAKTSGFKYLKLTTTDPGTDGTGTFTLPASCDGKTWGTDYHVYILAEDERDGFETDYASVPFEIEHPHEFTLSAAGEKITAECSVAGCGLTDSKAVLEIKAPKRNTYLGSGDSNAALEGLNAFNAATGLSVKESDIKYEGVAPTVYSESSTPPEKSGNYRAKITEGSLTAYIDYEIKKAVPACTAPTGITVYTGKTLSDITLSGDANGNWSWKDGSESVGDAGTKTFKALYTPNDTDNYETFETDVTVEVKEKENTIVPSPSPSPSPTPSPTPGPEEKTPSPTPSPSPEPSPSPAPEPMPEPSPSPTPEPTQEPTPAPAPEPLPDTREHKTPDLGGLTLNGKSLSITLYSPANSVSYDGWIHVWKGVQLTEKQKKTMKADLDLEVTGIPDTAKAECITKKSKDASKGGSYYYLKLLPDKDSAAYNALSEEEKKKLGGEIKKINKVLKKKENVVPFTIAPLDLGEFVFDSKKSSKGKKVFVRKNGSGDTLTLTKKSKKHIDPVTFVESTTTYNVLEADIEGHGFQIPKKDYKKSGSADSITITGKNRNLTGEVSGSLAK